MITPNLHNLDTAVGVLIGLVIGYLIAHLIGRLRR